MDTHSLSEIDQPRLVRTWYGVDGEVVIEGELWHWVRLGRVPIPHPPLINLLIRRGLPMQVKRQLSYWHEVGHMQTLPLALAHALLLSRSRRVPLWLHVPLALLGHEALWELAAESYVVWKAGSKYRELYRKRPNPFQPAFWLVMAAISAITTWWLACCKWREANGSPTMDAKSR